MEQTLPNDPSFCVGCERLAKMMLKVGVGMMQCSICGWIVLYPEDDQVHGQDNRRRPSFEPASGWNLPDEGDDQ